MNLHLCNCCKRITIKSSKSALAWKKKKKKFAALRLRRTLTSFCLRFDVPSLGFVGLMLYHNPFFEEYRPDRKLGVGPRWKCKPGVNRWNESPRVIKPSKLDSRLYCFRAFKQNFRQSVSYFTLAKPPVLHTTCPCWPSRLLEVIFV